MTPLTRADAPLVGHDLGPAATRLIARGYRVLLLGADGKTPLTKRYGQPHGWHDATDDLLELEHRFLRAGKAARGVGVVVGGPDAPVVVDADGVCAISALSVLIPAALKTAPSEYTRKGLHLFFAPNTSIRRAVRSIPVECTCGGDCGIDVLGTASTGGMSGYVAVAPSKDKMWVWPDGGLPGIDLLPTFPDELRTYSPPPQLADESELATLEAVVPPAIVAQIASACDVVRRAERGQRHNTLLSAANRLGYEAARHNCGNVEVLTAALVKAAQATGMPFGEAARTATDGVKYGMRRCLARRKRSPERVPVAVGEVDTLSLEGARDRLTTVTGEQNTLVEAGTGTGKTLTVIPQIVAAQDTTLIVTTTLDLARQIADNLSEAGHPALVHVGRQGRDERDDDDPPGPYECAHHETIVSPLGIANHVAAPNACAHCVEGHLGMSMLYLRRGDLDKAADAETEAHNLAAEQGRDVDACSPCQWIQRQDEERQARVLVTTAQAFTPEMAGWRSPGGKVQRHVVVDENVPLVTKIVVTANNILEWKTLAANLLDAWRGPATDEWAVQLEEMRDYYTALLTALATAPTPEAKSVATRKVVEDYRPTLEAAIVGSQGVPTAPTERAHVAWDGTVEHFPLRAIEAMLWASKYGAWRVTDDSELVIVAPTPLLKTLKDGTCAGWTILDATPDPTVRALVEALGGHILEAIPTQPVHVNYHVARVHGKRALAADQADEVNAIIWWLDAYPTFAALGHKQVIKEVRERRRDFENRTTWWGRHRGTNDFAGRDLLIVGSPVPSPQDIDMGWLTHQAVMSWVEGSPPASHPSDDRAHVSVEVAPGVWAASPLLLPADDEKREWILTRIENEVIQAVGRARAGLTPDRTTQVVIVGPPVRLARGGITDVTIHYTDPDCWPPCRAAKKAARHAIQGALVASAVIQLRSEGASPTVRAAREKYGEVRRALGARAAKYGIANDRLAAWVKLYSGMSDADLAEVVKVLDEVSGQVEQHGAVMVGRWMAEVHDREHGAECHCAGRAAVDFLLLAVTMAGDTAWQLVKRQE